MSKDKLVLKGLVICVLVIVLSLLSGINPRRFMERAEAAGGALPWKEPSSDSGHKDRPIVLSFDVLKKWTYIAGKTPIPDSIRAFDGKSVEMTGYMMALNTVDNIRSFILMPSLFGCCYGQPPAVNHVVLVKMAGGKTANYFDDAVRVRGRFHCSEEKYEDELLSLYRIDADEVVAK